MNSANTRAARLTQPAPLEQGDSVSGRRKQNAGFTLVELLIVMTIIGVLMMVAVPRFESAIRMAREAALRIKSAGQAGISE